MKYWYLKQKLDYILPADKISIFYFECDQNLCFFFVLLNKKIIKIIVILFTSNPQIFIFRHTNWKQHSLFVSLSVFIIFNDTQYVYESQYNQIMKNIERLSQTAIYLTWSSVFLCMYCCLKCGIKPRRRKNIPIYIAYTRLDIWSQWKLVLYVNMYIVHIYYIKQAPFSILVWLGHSFWNLVGSKYRMKNIIEPQRPCHSAQQLKHFRKMKIMMNRCKVCTVIQTKKKHSRKLMN